MKKTGIIVRFLLFIFLIYIVFIYLTNVFRPASTYDRAHIIGFDEQQDLDVVYIGGSTCFVFFEPLQAWNDYGFTSYDYSINGLEASSIEYMVKHAESKMSPDLYIIGVRPFQLWSETGNTGALRYVTDSWNVLSINRLSLINNFSKYHTGIDKESYLSYVFDIGNYHNNIDSLKNPANWQFKLSQQEISNKGWEWVDRYQFLSPPDAHYTDKRASLMDNDEVVLRKLCKYCKDSNLNVLFVVCPYYIEEEDQMVYNTISDIVSEYGFDFLDTNKYYAEMGLDFQTDFYNRRHVNVYGADKYTDFLANYITNRYEIKNHKGDSRYEEWDEEYKRFAIEKEEHKITIDSIRENHMAGFKLAEELRDINDFGEWYSRINNERYTLIVYDNRNNNKVKSYQLSYIMNNEWDGMPISGMDRGYYIGLPDQIIDSGIIDKDLFSEAVIGYDSPTNGMRCKITSDSIQIDDVEYYNKSDGIIAIAVDNYLWLVADEILINETDQGLSIRHGLILE